jgi:hypothetical protein
MEPIRNRVAESEIEVYNLEKLWDGREIIELDLEPFLVEGLVLREIPFREAVKEHDWQQYQDKHVAVFCSTDAIIPTWAYMLIASRVAKIAASIALGRTADLLRDHFTRALEEEDWSRFEDKPVVIKGCGSRVVPPNAYLLATRKLQDVAGKLMYGEPCSSVPLWRKPKSPKSVATNTRPAATKVAGPPPRR